MITNQAEIAVRIIQKLARRLEDADALITILTKRDPKTRVILGLAREGELRGFPGSDGRRGDRAARPHGVLAKRSG